MADKIDKVGETVVQHGKFNDRIYVMKLSRRDCPEIVGRLDALAREKGYSKVFAKVPEETVPLFRQRGYRQEATIPNYFKGEEDVYFMGKFFSGARASDEKEATISRVLEAALAKAPLNEPPPLAADFRLREARPDDAPAIAAIYRQVFATYPFPIHDPDYITDTMADNYLYFVVETDEGLAAVSSAEMYPGSLSVEMTDFATPPEFRGHGLALALLYRMEAAMRTRHFKTAYTIARAYSFGMNITFAKLGYDYSGTLVKNTNISGALESMNVWYKPL